MSLSRRTLLVGAAIGCVVPLAAQAQTRRWIFAWAYESGTSRTFVSSSVTEFAGGSWDAPTARWNSALRRYGGPRTSAVHVGTPSDLYYSSAQEADDARYDFINQERRRGRDVEIYDW